MSKIFFGAPVEDAMWIIIGVVFILSLMWAVSTNEARSTFGVAIPTAEQRALLKDRNSARNDWLKLRDAIELATREGMDEAIVESLRGASIHARNQMHLIDEVIQAERARVSDFDEALALADKWK